MLLLRKATYMSSGHFRKSVAVDNDNQNWQNVEVKKWPDFFEHTNLLEEK